MVKVSVVIPVYNVEKYLAECLDSVINQTLNDIEVICINDGSTDNSLSILEEYAKKDDRIRIISQENSGLSVSRNHGINLSQGEYIYFMDSDDYMDLNTIEECYNFSKNNDLDMLIFKLINFLDDNPQKKFTSRYYEMKFLEKYHKKIFNFNDMGVQALNIAVSTPGKFFKKSLIYTMRFPEGLIFEDNVFFTEAILKAKRISFLNKHFYNRRIRENSITTTKSIKFSDSIIISNMIVQLSKKYEVYEIYKNKLVEKKIKSVYARFLQVDIKYKNEFFNLMKEDFKKYEQEYRNNVNFKKMDDICEYIFQFALKYENYTEFQLNVEIHKYYNRINKLKRSQNKINKKIYHYNFMNKEILSSNSWRLTKPFRKILGVFK